ncbi:hypothetical protein JCM10213_003135 [Rhodosporidiobolus nylandii]
MSSNHPSAPSALPSHLLHLTTLLLLSRSSSSPSSSAPAQPGFTHARTLPLHVLTHLLREYLALLASTAAAATERAGRAKGTVWDVADALEELGFGGRKGVEELREEAERAQDGVEEEAEQVRELAKGLQEHLSPAPLQPPLAQLSYDPLRPDELSLLELVASLPSGASAVGTPGASEDDDEGESEEESELASPPPQAEEGEGEGEKVVQVKGEPGTGAMPTATATAQLDFAGLGDLGLLTGGVGEADAAFFDSLGLPLPLSSSASATAGMNGVEGVGDLPVSIFHPLDLAGRPLEGIDMLAPLGADMALSALDALAAAGAGPGVEDEDADARPFPAWRDQSLIPDWVPPHLPPFPGMEQETDSALSRKRRREAERAREKEKEQREALSAAAAHTAVGRAAAALMMGGGAAGDPWEEAIPYSASSLAQMAAEFPNSLPTPGSPHREGEGEELGKEKEKKDGGAEGEGEGEGAEKRKRKRRRSLSPPPTASTSLGSFAQIQPLIPHAPSLLRANPLRRTAASYISHNPRHPELSISSDSLFGSLPYAAPLRQATLPPGFLPEQAPPNIHPFNTNLPYTVSAPVPYHPSSSSSLLPAPPPNPRIPAPLASLARELSNPMQFDPRPGKREELHPNLALFSRLLRIGPPGPLGPKGEALNYEYIGNTALLQMSGVDWQERRFNAKLPRSAKEEEKQKGVGIKLKLGGGTKNADGRQTREGSLAAGTPWGSGSPAPVTAGATPGPSFATPAPSSLAASTSTSAAPLPSLNGFDFTTLGLPSSASAPPPPPSAPSSSAAPDTSFQYPDFLLSAGGLASLTSGLDSSTIAGFDWAGLGVDLSAPAPAAAAGGEQSVDSEAGGARAAVEGGGMEIDPVSLPGLPASSSSAAPAGEGSMAPPPPPPPKPQDVAASIGAPAPPPPLEAPSGTTAHTAGESVDGTRTQGEALGGGGGP